MSLKETPINNPRVPPTEKSWPNAPSEIYYVMVSALDSQIQMTLGEFIWILKILCRESKILAKNEIEASRISF